MTLRHYTYEDDPDDPGELTTGETRQAVRHGPRYEERVTFGGITVREDGVVVSEDRSPARPGGETRAAAPPSHPHEALSVVHSHPHSSYSSGGGEHDHLHAHTGDANHQHSHANAPGQPGPGMPSVQLHSSQPAGDTRADDQLVEDVATYLRRGGVDLARELRHLEYAREDQATRTRNQATRLKMLAGRLHGAQRDLEGTLISYRHSWAGVTSADVTRAHNEVEKLRAELLEECSNDEDLMSRVRHDGVR